MEEEKSRDQKERKVGSQKYGFLERDKYVLGPRHLKAAYFCVTKQIQYNQNRLAQSTSVQVECIVGQVPNVLSELEGL